MLKFRIDRYIKESCLERNWHFIGNENTTENELNPGKIQKFLKFYSYWEELEHCYVGG